MTVMAGLHKSLSLFIRFVSLDGLDQFVPTLFKRTRGALQPLLGRKRIAGSDQYLFLVAGREQPHDRGSRRDSEQQHT